MTPLTIAIDGPTGAGKGTVARALARALGYRHVDTGAMYRAVGWKALHDAIALDDAEALEVLARDATIMVEDGRVVIDGHDVSGSIRTPTIDHAASRVARLPAVRAVLVRRQRALAAGGGVIMEGRDIGTVVLPEAEVKIFLDASREERARRRATDASHSSGAEGTAAVAAALEARDHADTTRAASPLARAADAAYIDTTNVPIGRVVSRAQALVDGARAKGS